MSELDDRLSEGRAAVATMGPPADLWERVVEHSNDGDAAVLDPTVAPHRRRPSLWLAVAAVLALLALVGTLTLRDDDHGIDTVPADTPGTASTTTEAPRLTAFAIPSSFELPDGWDLLDEGPFYRLAFGPVSGLPQTRMEFVVPEEAATPEAAVAHLAATDPSSFVLGDPIPTTVGQRSTTCMDVEAADDGPRAPLLHFRSNGGDDQPPEDREVTLDEGAVGRVCVIDAQGHEGEAPLVVLIQAPADEFPAFLAQAQAVLDDLEFELPAP